MSKQLSKGKLVTLVAGVVVVAAAAVGGAFAAGVFEDEPLVRTAPEDILVSPEWVEENRDEVTILEIGRDFEDYDSGHVPGAAFIEGSVIAGEVDGVSAMLPDPDTVAADLAEMGVSSDKPVVVYDAGSGTWASRLFWALEYLGHEQVHLLDGGLTAWDESGREFSEEIDVPERGEFAADVRPNLIADQEHIEENLNNDDVLMLDARSPQEYVGDDVRADRGGHIPGAVNIDFVNNRSDSGGFRPVEELVSVYEEALEGHEGAAITYCQAGFRAAHSYVALRVLGEEDARMYDGSWSEWGNDESAPIEGDA